MKARAAARLAGGRGIEEEIPDGVVSCGQYRLQERTGAALREIHTGVYRSIHGKDKDLEEQTEVSSAKVVGSHENCRVESCCQYSV